MLKVDSLAYITVITPNGGEAWEVNSVHEIKWQSQNTSGTVTIEYSIDNGTIWTIIDSSAGDNHHYSWTIPNSPSTSCRVKITDIDSEPFDRGDSIFTITEPLAAEFKARPTAGIRPLTVRFSDQSSGLIDSWYWEFGDGATSIDQNPTHRYMSAGAYSVSLTVAGPTGQDKETKLNYIKIFVKRSVVFGEVYYYTQDQFVPGTILNLAHAGGISTDTTDADGRYYFEAIPGGNVQLVPLKQIDQGNFITGSDVLLMLRYLALLDDLTEDQLCAADVTGDGKVTGLDARAILSYFVFDEDNMGNIDQWRFVPDTSEFDLQADTTVNFKSFLSGDINGDWKNSGDPGRQNIGIGNQLDSSKTILKICEVRTQHQNEIDVAIKVELLEDTLNTLILSIAYDPQILKFTSVQKSNSIQKFMAAANGNEPGKVHLAMADVEENNLEHGKSYTGIKKMFLLK